MSGQVLARAGGGGGAPGLVVTVLRLLPGALSVDNSLVHKGENTLSIRVKPADCGAVAPRWSLTAVVLLVIKSSELETVVAAANQRASTAGVAVVDAAV